ncbi:MAG: flagellar hook-associated protein FlgK [Acidobacteria bacterium]|nr:flagellar hook-associated protein FlgK [Acidobacteriota bacterium]
MSNLLSSLGVSAGAMKAFERSLAAIQNNVTNATTPGYAKHRQVLSAMTFEPSLGYSGGVAAGDLISYRDGFAERAVRRAQASLGEASQRSADLERLEPLFDVSGAGGLPLALNRLFESFSTLSVAPNNQTARQGVLDSAGQLASTFNQAAASLRASVSDTARQIPGLVEKVNGLAGQIREINETRRLEARTIGAAGPDARLHNALEELAELADFTALDNPDGTTTVFLGGQTPLVIGTRQMDLQTGITSGAARLLDEQGKDITAHVRGGRLSALLEACNRTFPAYLTDLDRLAAGVAGRVNAVLAEGLDQAGNPPAQGLFVVSGSPAASLAAGGLRPEELAAAVAGAPGGNGNALRLAALANSKEIDGLTFSEFYGGLASRAGGQLSAARADQEMQSELLLQARAFRSQRQDVSLDEEAAAMLQFQRSYQAAAQMVKALDEMTTTVLQMIG